MPIFSSMQVIQLIKTAFDVLIWLIIIRCLLSFIRHDPYHPIIKFIYDLTEPIMKPFRKLIPSAGGIDFSPIFAVLAITLLQKLVITLLYSLF